MHAHRSTGSRVSMNACAQTVVRKEALFDKSSRPTVSPRLRRCSCCPSPLRRLAGLALKGSAAPRGDCDPQPQQSNSTRMAQPHSKKLERLPTAAGAFVPGDCRWGLQVGCAQVLIHHFDPGVADCAQGWELTRSCLPALDSAR